FNSVSNPRVNRHRTKLTLIKAAGQPLDDSTTLTSSDPLLPKSDDPRNPAGFVPFSPLGMPSPPLQDTPKTPPPLSSLPPRPSIRPAPPSAPPPQNTVSIPLSPRPAPPES